MHRLQQQESLPASVITLHKVGLVWLTSSPPVFPDQPFPSLLEGINEPLPSEHPPHPLLRASSRVWRSYANTCASELPTSSCFCLFATNPLQKIKENFKKNRSYHRCWAVITSVFLCMMSFCSIQTSNSEWIHKHSLMHADVTWLTSHVDANLHLSKFLVNYFWLVLEWNDSKTEK